MLEVPAGATASYELTFQPMTMTGAEGGVVEGGVGEGEKKHTGTLFFPLPDGTAVLYRLEGCADPPAEVGSIVESVPCKRSRSIPLTVSNWLKLPQRFRVEIRAEDKEPSTLLSGHEHLDVPAGLSREYM